MIENELKYVMTPDCYEVVHNALLKQLGDNLFVRDIKQGYLTGNGRIRSSQQEGRDGSYMFNYKMPLNDGTFFEVEKAITFDQFTMLWAYTTDRLEKTRLTYYSQYDNVTWDIDFFFDNTKIYFAMAESEMPEGMAKPFAVPTCVLDHMLLAVPREQNYEYSSKKISDPKYAKARLVYLTADGSYAK